MFSKIPRLGWTVYGATQVVLLAWWVGFYPGLMSYDSVMYIWQATTSHWSTSHSVAYNALLWLSLQASGEVAPLTLAQTVALAAGLAYAVIGLREVGGPGRWLGVAAIAAVVLPVVGTFAIYVSKDTAFAIAQVWALGTVARLLARPGRQRGLLWTLFAEMSLMALFRQNGFVVIGLATVVLVAVMTGRRRALLACGAGAIAVAFAANFGVYPALGVQKAGSELVLGPAYADLAVAYRDRPDAFDASDRALLATVAPLKFWRDSANCYVADDTVSPGNHEFSLPAARAHQGELAALWVRVAGRAPDVVSKARLCRGSIGWNPWPAPPQGRTVKIPLTGTKTFFAFPRSRIAASPFRGAVHQAPLIAPVHDAAAAWRRATDIRAAEWIAWRGATWAYVSYVAVAVFARRQRSMAFIALAALTLGNQVNVVVNNPSQLVRYMAPALILGVLLLPLAFAQGRKDVNAATLLPAARVR